MEAKQAPRYRADAKGQIAKIKEECADIMRNQINAAEEFILAAEDCPCYEEYADILTPAELSACFKKAMRA